MSTRREQVVVATLDVLAESGSRGLTHRAVDRRAGVPLGTTGNWFPSRDALLTAAVEELERRDQEATAALIDGAAPPADVGALAVFVHGFLAAHLTDDGAVRARARYALMLERPDLVRPAHERLLALFSGLVERWLGTAPDESARRLAADLLDGAILHRVTVRSGEDPDLDALSAEIVRLVARRGGYSCEPSMPNVSQACQPER